MEQTQPAYAGFWMRFLAYIIDSIVLSIVAFIILMPVLALIGLTAAVRASDFDMNSGGIGILFALLSAYFVAIMALMVVHWLYYALMESSSRGATLGKMALGIRVTDMGGNRISFAKATGRHFAKILSSLILCIGYMMAGFTQQKQALHDILAGCLVVRN